MAVILTAIKNQKNLHTLLDNPILIEKEYFFREENDVYSFSNISDTFISIPSESSIVSSSDFPDILTFSTS